MLQKIIFFICISLPIYASSVYVSTITPKSMPLYSTVEADGVVVSKNKISITAKTSGIIHFTVFQNSVVFRGDIIATVQNLPREKRLHYLLKKLNLQKDEFNVYRTKLKTAKEKYAMGVGTKNDYLSEKIASEQLKEIYLTTQSEYETLLLEQKNATIKAPQDGTITNIIADNTYINYGSKIAQLLDENNLVKLFVNSRDVTKITKGMQIQLQSSYTNCEATIINTLAKSTNNLIEVIAKPNKKLPLNLRVTAKIELKELYGILIPKEAIVLVNNRPAVYLIDKNSTAHLVFITIQKDMVQNALIKNTLPRDARVALKNAYMLHDNLEVSMK